MVLKCGHIFCIDCTQSMLNQRCTICKLKLKDNDFIKIPVDCIPDVNANSITESTKLTKIVEIVEDAILPPKNEKVLIFSQWATFLKIISNKLNEYDINNVLIDGKSSQVARKTNISDFHEYKHTKVFLATYKVGGVGLNLTIANHVILADMWWNPSVEDQAVDRTHRMGQRKEVKVYKMYVNNTIENDILNLQENKKILRDNLIDYKQGDPTIGISTRDLIQMLI